MPDDKSPPRLDDVADLFAEAIELGNAHQRDLLVESVRQRDPELATHLAMLIGAHFADPNFLAEPISTELTGVMTARLDSAMLGQQVGSWQVDEVLHRGGMGVVYRAHRAGVDFEQQAALKVIRMGLDSPELLRMFAQERRLLARLEHRNIARLLDGGTTREGLPYLVMEHVRGEMIDQWCAREQPSLSRLLAVFAQICSAVNFAHQNLVVHQDIKPANILVAEDGTAKLLDFGIAELERHAGSDAQSTVTGNRMLTPGFASPEQYRGERAGTATDTYSLGVLLYRLLTGEMPHDIDAAMPREEAARLVDQHDPRPPSQVLRSRGKPLPRRATDLDAIILRALHRNPAERYSSVLAFAHDLSRYSRGMPVEARPRTLLYRAARFTGRNWFAVGALSTILILLVAGLGVAIWQARNVERQRDVARTEAATAASAVGFLQFVLGSADPWRDAEAAETVEDVITIAESEVDSLLADQPAARAYVLSSLGQVAAGRGETDRADRLTAAAVAILDSTPEITTRQAAAVRLGRAIALEEDGRTQEALPHALEAVRLFELDGIDNWNELAVALNQLAAVHITLGDHVQADSVLQRAIALYHDNGGESMLGLAAVYNNRAVALANLPDRAEDVAASYARAAEIVERGGASAPRHATLLVNQANALRLLDRTVEAESLFVRAIGMFRESLGDDHPSTLTAAASLATLHDAVGNHHRAVEVLRGALSSALASLPPDHPVTAYIQNVMGAALCQTEGSDNLREGLALSRASLDARRAAFGDDHWSVASTEAIVGYCLLRLDRRGHGEGMLQRAYHTLLEQRGADNDLTVRAQRWLMEGK